MTRRLLLLALVALAVAWLLRRPGPDDPGASAAIDPCRDSLAWRVGAVDTRFPISADRLEEAVAAAARLWNDAAGRRVLVHGADDGFPVDLVYDERQSEAFRRRSERERISELHRDVELHARRHRALVADYEAARDVLERRAEALERRVADYNETVERWNRTGGAPADEARRLERTARELEAERADLAREARAVERKLEQVNAQAERATRASERLERATERYNRENAGRSVQSGGFAVEVETNVLGRVVRVDRSITIYHFEDADDLTRVLAHELGHALGIDHVDDPAALMHERHEVGGRTPPPGLRPADVAALGALCAAPLPDRSALLLDPSHPEWRRRAPDVYRARFETSRGEFVIEAVREHAPIGADRFYNLVRLGYYDDTRFHRVVPDYIVQFGLHGDPAVNRAWRDRQIPDDPPRGSNVRGTVAFAMSPEPNTRNTQIYINLSDNTRNDREPFAIFGRVVEGMEVLDRLYSGYGERSGSGVRQGRQGPIIEGGNAYLDREFPRLDRIIRATVEDVPRGRPRGR